jgi:GT2 family glycosyltransferase
MTTNSKEVTVVLPVYNGYDYLMQLLPTIERTNISYQLVIIDDSSPDARIKSLLTEYSNNDKRITVLSNHENLGFVASVNSGLKLAKNHAVILNSDTMVPNGWLERLIEPFNADSHIASATPFSNAATIFSFPIMNLDNELPYGIDYETIDRLFQKEQPEYNTVPTGHGFCMAMSAPALQRIGLFDCDAFGRGYGEENDWCLRAAKLGFRNIVVENLFILHKHGGSFQKESAKLKQEHGEILEQRYPDYKTLVRDFVEADPIKKYRDSVMKQLENPQ